MPLTLLQVVCPSFYGPIYKGILLDIRSLLSVPKFPNTMNPTQIARTSLSVAYSLPSLFPRVSFKKCAFVVFWLVKFYIAFLWVMTY
jgi:hypothetical protein